MITVLSVRLMLAGMDAMYWWYHLWLLPWIGQ